MGVYTIDWATWIGRRDNLKFPHFPAGSPRRRTLIARASTRGVANRFRHQKGCRVQALAIARDKKMNANPGTDKMAF